MPTSSSPARSQSPAPSPPPAASPQTPPSLVTFDPAAPLPLLTTEEIMTAHNKGHDEDTLELEGIMEEFGQLEREFKIWGLAKFAADDEKYWNELVKDEEEIQQEQNGQGTVILEESRETIKGILTAIRNLFNSW